jgi:hypothetical protein
LKSINSNGLVWLDNFVYFSSSLCKDFFLVSFLIRFFFQPVRLRRRLIDRTFEKKKKEISWIKKLFLVCWREGIDNVSLCIVCMHDRV